MSAWASSRGTRRVRALRSQASEWSSGGARDYLRVGFASSCGRRRCTQRWLRWPRRRSGPRRDSRLRKRCRPRVEATARPGAAERHLRPAWDRLGATGEVGYRATVGTLLAEALVLQGRLDDAAALVDECASLAAEDDVLAQAGTHTVRALVATHRGN